MNLLREAHAGVQAPLVANSGRFLASSAQSSALTSGRALHARRARRPVHGRTTRQRGRHPTCFLLTELQNYKLTELQMRRVVNWAPF
jgi:hypothetical protein